MGMGVRHGVDDRREDHVTERRRQATAAFWSIAAFTIILVSGLGIASTLYQQQVNTSIRSQAYLSCLERSKLQREHNDLAAAVTAVMDDTAKSRRGLAVTATPRDAAIMRASANRLVELAETVDPITVVRCRR
jgi:hypothetical protein